MPVIKRYANRKLYDTESKRYVSLDDLAESIRRGEEVRVVDHVTGEDLTSLTLVQVIFEEEKKIGGLLPQVLLTRLIRTGGGRVNALRSRLAAIDPFQIVDEEIRRRLSQLVEHERITPEEAQSIQDLLIRKPAREEGVRIPVRDEEGGVVEATPGPMAGEELADQAEVEALLHQVEQLEQEIQRMRAADAPPAA
jgi:polyhydroxyalkanoate synthesis repressor PhaR